MFSASPIQAFGSVRALGLAESGAPIRWTRSPPPWWPTMALRSASVTVRTEAARRKRGSKWGKAGGRGPGPVAAPPAPVGPDEGAPLRLGDGRDRGGPPEEGIEVGEGEC